MCQQRRVSKIPRFANQRKDYAQLYGEGTAVTLRLTQEYYGTGRVVHADSPFSSVKTLLALQERGLHFMGMVKTAHKEYPLAYLKSWALGHESEKEPVHERRVLFVGSRG